MAAAEVLRPHGPHIMTCNLEGEKMKRVLQTCCFLLVVTLCSSWADAQEGGVPPHKLAQLGLGGMTIVPDGYDSPGRSYELLPSPHLEHAPAHDFYQPVIIGQRQFYTLQSLRNRDRRWLGYYGWLQARRTRGYRF